jgi:hypothetical protein
LQVGERKASDGDLFLVSHCRRHVVQVSSEINVSWASRK